MSQGNGNIGGYVLAGAGIGLLMLFRPVRWFIGLGFLYLMGMFIWDMAFTEHKVPGTDTSVYEFTIDSIEQSTVTFEPSFDINMTVKNTGKEFMQDFYTTATLYECPAEDSPMSACDPVTKKPMFLAINREPGFKRHIHQRISFSDQPSARGHYLVQINVDEIAFDSDAKSA